jgi:hypothetical protein
VVSTEPSTLDTLNRTAGCTCAGEEPKVETVVRYEITPPLYGHATVYYKLFLHNGCDYFLALLEGAVSIKLEDCPPRTVCSRPQVHVMCPDPDGDHPYYDDEGRCDSVCAPYDACAADPIFEACIACLKAGCEGGEVVETGYTEECSLPDASTCPACACSTTDDCADGETCVVGVCRLMNDADEPELIGMPECLRAQCNCCGEAL